MTNFTIMLIIAAMLSIAGCADNIGERHDLRNPGPLKNYGQTI